MRLIARVDYQIINIQSEANKGNMYSCQALKNVLTCDVSACNGTKRGIIHNSGSVI